MSQDRIYVWSFDEENFGGSFATREDAIAEGAAYAKPGQPYWIGQRSDRSIAAVTPSGGSLIEDMHTRVCDEIGESGEDWLDDVTAEEIEDLEESVQAAIVDWAGRRSIRDSYYAVVDVQEYRAPSAPVSRDSILSEMTRLSGWSEEECSHILGDHTAEDYGNSTPEEIAKAALAAAQDESQEDGE